LAFILLASAGLGGGGGCSAGGCQQIVDNRAKISRSPDSVGRGIQAKADNLLDKRR
jgi:hypothetical protein